MNSKSLIWFYASIGSIVFGMIPALWGAGEISFSSIIFGGIGAIVGIYVGWKTTN